ncbi:ankyrin [Hypoxylon rubiginosum]|uniref:Ankyrin n=1 Tax=Hypoxylon rubiginosum TaxID=110542 RepID=A0ACC0CW71_9PEZI|nr:ankyrin [Hypoxylon rubiginosum]
MDQFKYESLNLERLAFRLVRLQGGVGIDIECELIHATLDENGIPYEAVSYTWGSTKKTETIYIGAKRVRLDVTRNLLLILHDLRYPDRDRYLWIDAICINQDDVRERGHQVQQMKHIYSDAERVLFCVGRPTELTRVLMTSLVDLQKLTRGLNWKAEDPRWNIFWETVQGKTEDGQHDLRHKQRQALEYLLGQSWFRRVWILQEVGNAKAATVYCGRESVLARIFAIAPRLLGVEPDSHCQAVLDLIPGPSRKQLMQNEHHDLYSLLSRFSRAEAQDERDKIYALLGLCTDSEDDLTIIPDYEMAIEVVIRQTVSRMCFCDIYGITKLPYTTMAHFSAELSNLYSVVLRCLIDSGFTTSMRSSLEHCVNRFEFTIEALNYLEGKLGLLAALEIFHHLQKHVALESWSINNIKVWKQWGAGLLFRSDYDVESAQRLLDFGVDIETRDENCRTPLVLAAGWGHLEKVRLLLDSGADIEARNEDGRTPLLEAANRGRLENTRLLLDYGANIETRNKNGWTPLLEAARYNHIEVAQLLISSGVNVEIGDQYGWTPLLLAVRYNHREVAQLLLISGANIEIKDEFGRTPLRIAKEYEYLEVTQMLQSFGAISK